MSLTLSRLAALAAALMIAAPLSAETAPAQGQIQGDAPDHRDDHAHDHGTAPETRTVAQGYFEDAAVAARPLSDWEGDWQSVYPHLMAGRLDPVMKAKAEKGDKTEAEYRAYYETGYKTDVDRIEIRGDRVTFHRAGGSVTGQYADDGHEVLTYAKGNRGVRYSFRKVGGDAAAPGFIQFSDHKIAPQKADHYHLYWGDDRAAVLAELTNWPTYYPAQMDAAAVRAEMLAH